jgi:hypothetical protein
LSFYHLCLIFHLTRAQELVKEFLKLFLQLEQYRLLHPLQPHHDADFEIIVTKHKRLKKGLQKISQMKVSASTPDAANDGGEALEVEVEVEVDADAAFTSKSAPFAAQELSISPSYNQKIGHPSPFEVKTIPTNLCDSPHRVLGYPNGAAPLVATLSESKSASSKTASASASASKSSSAADPTPLLESFDSIVQLIASNQPVTQQQLLALPNWLLRQLCQQLGVSVTGCRDDVVRRVHFTSICRSGNRQLLDALSKDDENLEDNVESDPVGEQYVNQVSNPEMTKIVRGRGRPKLSEEEKQSRAAARKAAKTKPDSNGSDSCHRQQLDSLGNPSVPQMLEPPSQHQLRGKLFHQKQMTHILDDFKKGLTKSPQNAVFDTVPLHREKRARDDKNLYQSIQESIHQSLEVQNVPVFNASAASDESCKTSHDYIEVTEDSHSTAIASFNHGKSACELFANTQPEINVGMQFLSSAPSSTWSSFNHPSSQTPSANLSVAGNAHDNFSILLQQMSDSVLQTMNVYQASLAQSQQNVFPNFFPWFFPMTSFPTMSPFVPFFNAANQPENVAPFHSEYHVPL